MPKTAAEIARGLSEAQKAVLLDCTPWDVCVGAGVAIAFCAYGFLQDSSICDDGVELNPLGLEVRALIAKEKGE